MNADLADDPAVAVISAELKLLAAIELQFEIARPAAPPDNEGVALDDSGRRDFADERTVIDAPVRRIALPPASVFPSKMLSKPASSPARGSGRWLCFGT
jgi:hypothetical protein